MTSDDYLTHDSVEGAPWDTRPLEQAQDDILGIKWDLENHSLLSPDIGNEFDRLIMMLERDIDGMKHANRY